MTDHSETPTVIEPPTISDMLDHHDAPQMLNVWIDVNSDRDVLDRVCSDQVVIHTRPQDLALDRLGLPQRLRLAEITLKNLERHLESGAVLDAETLTEIEAEEVRLRKELRKIRQQELKLINKKVQTYESEIDAAVRKELPDYELRNLEASRRLPGLKWEHDRLLALV